MNTLHPLQRSLAPVIFLILAATTFGQNEVRLEEPIEDFRVPKFNELGFREWHVRAALGTYQNENEVLIETMRVRQFKGDGSGTVIGTLETPKAKYIIDSQIIVGSSDILAKSDSFQLTGSDWTWQAEENRLTINKNPRVLIFSELGDILK